MSNIQRRQRGGRSVAGRMRAQWDGTGDQGFAGAGAACPTNVNDSRYSCQGGQPGCDSLPACGCNVIGANTFNQDFNGAGLGLGLAAGAVGNLAIDAGDSCRWQPRSMLLTAYQAASVNPDQIDVGILAVPVLLTNARVGSIPMIRRTGAVQFGIISDGYSDRKEITCVDWAPFTSVQNQGLTLSFQNIADTLPIHVFVVLWGDNLG